MDKLKELVEKEICCIEESGINQQNVDLAGKLVDIHKDICNEEYWETKKEAYKMRYEDEEYGYGARRRDGRGRYMADRGVYNVRRGRGSGTRYGGGDKIYDIMDGWEEYKEGMDEYKDRGSYGAKEKGLESLEYMLDAFVKWFEDIAREAETQEEVDLIKKYAKKIKEM